VFDLRKSFVLSGLRISAVVSLFVITMIAAFNLSGCGGSSASPSVSVTATQTTVDGSGGASGSGAAQTSTLTATVTNDKSTNGSPDGVTWTVSGAPSSSLSGTSTTGATFTAPAATSTTQTVTITATSVADTSKSGTATITVPALIASSTTTAQLTGVVGTVYSQQLTITGGNGTNTWTTTPVSGSLPPGWTISTSGVLSGPTAPTAGQSGTYTFTVAVKDSGTYSANLPLTVTINPAPTITFPTTTTLTAGTYNVVYPGSSVTATGGAGGLTYAVTSGSLPNGLGLNTSSGAITGTTTAVGTFTFKVTASDNFGDTMVSPQYTIVVSYPAMNITTSTLPTGYIGSTYTQTTLAATGGTGVAANYSWVVTGSNALPAGLTLSTGGVLSGTPTGSPSGPTSISFKVTDTVAGISTTVSLPITVGAAISITPVAGALPEAYANAAYSSGNLTASGGSGTGYTWTVASGSSLPSWLSLSATTGSTTTLTGTPTAAATAANFSLKVTDSVGNTATIAYNVTVGAGISISPVTGTTLAEAYANSPYTSVPLTASGGNGTYTWSVVSGSAPPSWMSLSATSGSSVNLTGTPTAGANAATFGLKVTDTAGNSATVSYSITVGTGIGISPVTGTAFTAYTGSLYTSPTLTATGGSGAGYTWSVASGSSLPSWLSLSSTSGATTTLTGTPTTVATAASFTLKVTDSGSNSQTVTYSITVLAGISITPTAGALPEAYARSPYTSPTLTASGGSGTGYTWSVASGSSLPTWMSLSSTSGASTTLTGTPTSAASAASFSLKVTDSVGNSATIAYNVTVGAGITITPPTIPTFYPGASYATTTYTAAGGAGGPYTWHWAAALGSALPSGLSLSTTGTITGTPINATNSSVTSQVVITAQDSGGNIATINATIVIEATLTVTSPATLPSGLVGTAYSQQLTASGGLVTTGYTWSVTSGAPSMATLGLSLSGSGLLTAPAFGATGSATFAVQVSDNAGTPHTAPATLTVNVSNFTLTITTPPPAFAVNGKSYSSGTFTATGGTGPYTWSISSGTLPTGLSLGSGTTATNTISGTVSSSTATGAYPLTVKVVDTSTSMFATYPYTLTVYSQPVQTPAPNPLPSPATAGQAYTASTITASGGSGNYSWAVSGNATSVFTVNNNGTYLSISGTPTKVGTYDLYVTLTDTTTSVSTAQIDYTIIVNETNPVTLPAPNPTSLPAATQSVLYTGAINAGGGTAPYAWTINGVTVTGGGIPLSNGLSASTSGGNTLSITGTPTTLTSVSLTDVIVTDTYGSTISPPGVSYIITVNPVVPTGYTVSGTVTYAGSQTGWVYLQLIPFSGCSTCGQSLGTAIDGRTAGSLASGKSFTINGVPPGKYSLSAFIDNTITYSSIAGGQIGGYGILNAQDATGTGVPTNFTITNSAQSGVSVTLSDPAATLNLGAPTWNPSQGSGAFYGGAVFSFAPVWNSNSIEFYQYYTVEYSTDSTFNSGVTTVSFPANGGNAPWVVTGLTNGSTYYFRAAGARGTGGSTNLSSWSATSPGVIIGAPSAGSLLSGTVTFTLPTGVSASGKTLYAGCYDTNTGKIYADPITSPTSGVSYLVYVPNGTNCQVFGFIDLNNAGLVGGPGEIFNTNGNSGAMVAVTVNGTTIQNITLPSGNSIAQVKTNVNTGGGPSYGIGFQVSGQYKLPVAVELLSETPEVTATVADVVLPADIATGAFSGNSDFFDYWPAVTGTPVVGDSYKFNVTYSDGTSEQLTAAVTGLLTIPFISNMEPQGSGVSTTPNFSWIDHVSVGNYVYQFQLNDNSSNTIWEIPPQHSGSNGFSNSITSIPWDVDPTNTGDLPNSSYLSSGALHNSTIYNWSIATYDSYGNEAQTQASFTTTAASLALSINGKGFGPALAGYPFTGSINASGGSGTYTTWTVNGTPITATSLGSAMTFSGNDGLLAYISGSTLYVVGTPPTAESSLPLNVTVIDSLSNTVTQNFSLVVSSGPGATGANDGLLSGTYVCKFTGYFDSDGARWASLSSFVANGSGSITSGVWDMNSRDFATAYGGTIASTSSYSVGADNMGVMTMHTTQTVGGSGTNTSTFAIAVNDANGATSTASEFRMVEIDDVGTSPTVQHGDGVCYQATTPFTPAASASYSYGLQGEVWSSATTAIPMAIVGRYDTNSTTLAISNDVYDVVAAGVGTNGTSAGTYIAPDANGRILSTTQPTGASYYNHYVTYIIDSNRMFTLETDPIGWGTHWPQLLAGDVRKQQQSNNTAAVLLSGSSVLYGQAYANSNGANVYQISGASTGTYTDTLTVNASYDDKGGVYSAGGENGQTVAVTLDSTNAGRATFAPGSGDSAYFYFFNAGSAFFMEFSTSGKLTTGWLEAQTQPSTPPFAGINIAGSYLMGELPRQNLSENDNAGEITLNSIGGVTGSGTLANAGILLWDQPFSATGAAGYSWLSTTYGAFSASQNGTAMSCVDITPVKSGATGKIVCMENTSGSGHVLIFEQ